MIETILQNMPKAEVFINDFVFIVMYLLVFSLGLVLFALTSSYKLHKELVQNKNTPVALSLIGYLLGVSAVYVAALSGPSHGLWADILSVSSYSGLGICFMIISRFLSDKIIFSNYSIDKELTTDKNIGIGSAQGGLYFATSLIAAGSVYGLGGGWLSSLVFFSVGQALLIAFAKIYEWVTPYRVFEEIEKDNVAVGIAYSGNVIALGVILSAAISGNFSGWVQDLSSFLFYALGGFILLPLVRLVLDRAILFRLNLGHEIGKNENIAVALIEFSIMVGISAIFFVFIK